MLHGVPVGHHSLLCSSPISDYNIVRLQPAQTAVLDRILSLERKSFPKGVALTAEQLGREARKRNNLLLYAVDAVAAEQVLGYVICTSNKLALHVSKVAVDPKHRRKGIATSLLLEAVSLSQRAFATLHLDPRNESAMALYAALGFRVDGVLEDYYAPGCPAHKLVKDLSSWQA